VALLSWAEHSSILISICEHRILNEEQVSYTYFYCILYSTVLLKCSPINNAVLDVFNIVLLKLAPVSRAVYDGGYVG
jgi:hypothetical protein